MLRVTRFRGVVGDAQAKGERMARQRSIGVGMALAVLLSAAAPALAEPELVVPALDETSAVYKEKVAADVDGTFAGAQQLVAALQSQDVTTARQAWVQSHAAWVRTYAVSAPLFRDISAKIDGPPDAARGFHAVEAKLFGAGGELPLAEAQDLLDNLDTFRNLFGRQVLSGHMVMVGIAALAYRIGEEAKIKGGESAASGTSLADLQHRIDALELGWNAVFFEYLKGRPARGSKEIPAQIDGLRKLVSVSSFDQIDPAVLTQQADSLANSLAEIAVDIGWRRPDYTDLE
jgi:iron uptake system component EfeO